jgi:putative transposase
LLLAVIVTEANFPERLGGIVVVMEAAQATDNLSLIWVDQGFSGEKFARVIQELIGAKVDVVCRTEPGFQFYLNVGLWSARLPGGTNTAA